MQEAQQEGVLDLVSMPKEDRLLALENHSQEAIEHDYHFTEDELDSFRKQVSESTLMIDHKEDEKKKVAARYKAEIDGLKNERLNKAQLINHGKEVRNSMCFKVVDTDEKKVHYFCMTSGELLHTRNATSYDEPELFHQKTTQETKEVEEEKQEPKDENSDAFDFEEDSESIPITEEELASMKVAELRNFVIENNIHSKEVADSMEKMDLKTTITNLINR